MSGRNAWQPVGADVDSWVWAGEAPSPDRVGEAAEPWGSEPATSRPALPRGPRPWDLRVRAEASPEWEAAGFRPLYPGSAELVRPVRHRCPELLATVTLGERLARRLRPGDLVVLTGPLGAGKTALTRGIARGLGVTGAVTSPTFVLARVHRGPLPLVHVDAYRLRSAADAALQLDDLDLDASLGESVTVVEWGEGLAEDLSESFLAVSLDRPGGDLAEQREVAVAPHGPRWAALSE